MPLQQLPDLTTLPATAPLFLKAALTGRKKPGESPAIPALAVTLKNVVLKGEHVAAYNKVCGLPEGTLAITYPQVVAAPLHMHVMLQPSFPLPLLGIVHLRNQITQNAPLSLGTPYDVRVQIGESRRSKLGIEVDVLTSYLADGETLWSATTTVLHRIKTKERSGRAAPAAPAAVTAQYLPFDVPADTGRRYAPVAQDYNPIHLYPITAKALGFDRAIAHGMWSVARSLGLLLAPYLAAQGGNPARLDIQFKQPLLLPGRVTLKYRQIGQGMDFDLLSREGGRTHLSGRIEGLV
ncbi:MAG: MaoC/PaaZ C-terminal domain-containing protein [Pseudomonadota bacterium]